MLEIVLSEEIRYVNFESQYFFGFKTNYELKRTKWNVLISSKKWRFTTLHIKLPRTYSPKIYLACGCLLIVGPSKQILYRSIYMIYIERAIFKNIKRINFTVQNIFIDLLFF